jgi:hypothetical protein
MSANMDLLNALAAQLGREKVVAMCEAFLSSGAPAAKQVKKAKKVVPASDTEEDKPKRQLPLKLVQWQAFVRYCKEKFPERFEGAKGKGAPAMQQLCKTLKEEEDGAHWTDFESSWVAPLPALEPAHNTGPAPRRASPGPAPVEEGEDTEDEEEKPKKKRQWSEEAKASAAAKRAAKKAAKGSDSESVSSAGKEKEE